jgi:arylsulfatase A-like enzyme
LKPNIVFLLVDSLRQDKCYGKNKSSITPNLDFIINEGTFFSQTISPSSITIPSLSSIFSGLYSYECTTLDHELFNMNPNIPTFIDILNKSGYHTNAIIPESLNHTNIIKSFSDVELFDSFGTLYDGVGEQIISKINNFKNSPWFLYVHLEDLHGNAIFHLQDGPKKFENKKFGKNQYDKMLSAADIWLGEILKTLDISNTIFIITADHGSTSADFTDLMQKFSVDNEKKRDQENDVLFNSAHKIMSKLPTQFSPFKKKIANIYTNLKNKKVESNFLPKLNEIELLELTNYQKRLLKKSVVYPRDCFDENFRPSLIFYGVNIPKNKIIHTQIGSIDIFPTIFDLMKISIENDIRGKSMLTLLNNKPYAERALMLDGASSESESKISNTIGIRTSKYKYFRDRFDNSHNIHLFDIKNDPLEENNIFKNNPTIVNNMELELQKINPNGDFSFKQLDQLSNDEEEKAKEILKKLGYI